MVIQSFNSSLQNGPIDLKIFPFFGRFSKIFPFFGRCSCGPYFMFQSSDKLSNIKNGEFLYNGDKVSQLQYGSFLNTKKKCLQI